MDRSWKSSKIQIITKGFECDNPRHEYLGGAGGRHTLTFLGVRTKQSEKQKIKEGVNRFVELRRAFTNRCMLELSSCFS